MGGRDRAGGRDGRKRRRSPDSEDVVQASAFAAANATPGEQNPGATRVRRQTKLTGHYASPREIEAALKRPAATADDARGRAGRTQQSFGKGDRSDKLGYRHDPVSSKRSPGRKRSRGPGPSKTVRREVVKASLAGALQFPKDGAMQQKFSYDLDNLVLLVSQRSNVAKIVVQHALLQALHREERGEDRALDIVSGGGAKKMFFQAMIGHAGSKDDLAFTNGLLPSIEALNVGGFPAKLEGRSDAVSAGRIKGDTQAFERAAGELDRALLASVYLDNTFKARQRNVIRALLRKKAPNWACKDGRGVCARRLNYIVGKINGDPNVEQMDDMKPGSDNAPTPWIEQLIKDHRDVLRTREWTSVRDRCRVRREADGGLRVGTYVYESESDAEKVERDAKWRRNHPWEVLRYYAFLLKTCKESKLKLRHSFTLAPRPHARRQYVAITPEVLRGLLRACHKRVDRREWEAHFGSREKDPGLPSVDADVAVFRKCANDFWWPKVFALMKKPARERRDTTVPRGKVAKGEKPSAKTKKKSRFKERAHGPGDGEHWRMRGGGGWKFAGLVATDGAGIDFHFEKVEPADPRPPRSKAQKVEPAVGRPPRSKAQKVEPADPRPPRSKAQKVEPAVGRPPRSKAQKVEPAVGRPPRSKAQKVEPADPRPPRSKAQKVEPAVGRPPRSKAQKVELADPVPRQGQCVVGVDNGRKNVSQAVIKRPDGKFIPRPPLTAARYRTESGQRRRALRTRAWQQEVLDPQHNVWVRPKDDAGRARGRERAKTFDDVMGRLVTTEPQEMEDAVKLYGTIYDDIWRVHTQLKWARERFRVHRLSQMAISRDLRGVKRCCARTGHGNKGVKRPPHLMVCGDAAFSGSGWGCLPAPVRTFRRKAKLTFEDFKAVSEFHTTKACHRCHGDTEDAYAVEKQQDASQGTSGGAKLRLLHDVRWCPKCEKFVARDGNAAKNMAELAGPDRPAYLYDPGADDGFSQGPSEGGGRGGGGRGGGGRGGGGRGGGGRGGAKKAPAPVLPFEPPKPRKPKSRRG
ncbi:unnamed protein product [Pedinophyceae sp. YPF-701]|nr:unnamed protein product [Pedinophyceae sp. YPF-701]